jgi:hypothetical protein
MAAGFGRILLLVAGEALPVVGPHDKLLVWSEIRASIKSDAAKIG